MFKLEIKTGGSAYRSETDTDKNGDFATDPYGGEVRRNLRDVMNKLAEGRSEGKIMDSNGNCVGKWKYE